MGGSGCTTPVMDYGSYNCNIDHIYRCLYSDRTGFWSCDSCCADFISLGPTLCASAHNHVSTDIVARYGFKSLEVNIFLRFKICDSRSYTWDNMWGDVVGLDFC